MATYTWADYTGREADALASLTSIRFDLASAMTLCRYMQQHYTEKHAPSEVLSAFSIGGLVQYSRAFTTGVREPLGSDAVATLTHQQQAAHTHFRLLRDKHIAHSVNAFEETKIQARYCEERVNEEGITSVNAVHYRVTGLALDDFVEMEQLCRALLKHVDARIKAENERILAIVRSLSIADVRAAGLGPALVPDHGKVGARRKSP